MKKLLLIFLLFFPVHGVWAKIINIVCTGPNVGTLSYILDASKGIVFNEAGNKHELITTPISYKWVSYLLKKDGSTTLVVHMLNRNTSILTADLYELTPEQTKKYPPGKRSLEDLKEITRYHSILQEKLNCEISEKKKF